MDHTVPIQPKQERRLPVSKKLHTWSLNLYKSGLKEMIIISQVTKILLGLYIILDKSGPLFIHLLFFNL